jgi:flagellar hook-associated protein 2
MNVDVRQTALAQQNAGTTQIADGNAVSPGNFSFAITTGGQTHNFNINVAADDDNSTIQQRMADAINQRNIGINATVTTGTNAAGGATSTLNLAARQTGTNNAFTVTDTTGNLASTMGITDISQNARNARFAINGGNEQTSQTNNISIRDGITLNLHNVGTTDITFGRGFGGIGVGNVGGSSSVNMATNIVNALNFALGVSNIAGTSQSGVRGHHRFVADIRGA